MESSTPPRCGNQALRLSVETEYSTCTWESALCLRLERLHLGKELSIPPAYENQALDV